MKTLCILTQVLTIGLFAVIPSSAQDKQESPEAIRPLLVKYLKAKDDDQRKEMLVGTIKPMGDKVVFPLQECLDVLIPCWRQGKDQEKKLKRRKKEIKDLSAAEVAKWVNAVVGKKAPATPELATAGAVKELQKSINYLAGIRGAIVRPEVVKFILEQWKKGASYPGQYKPLKEKYGRAAMAILLQLACLPSPKEDIRCSAFRALVDVAKPEKIIMKKLRERTCDEYESEKIRLAAAITLAKFGDQSGMEPFFAKAKKMAGRKSLKAQSRGWQRLANLWYNMGQFREAIKHYDKFLAILKELVEAKSRTTMDLVQAYYPRACAKALLGMVEEGIADLKLAVGTKGLRRGTLENDKELDNLRKHPEFQKIVDEAPTKVRYK